MEQFRVRRLILVDPEAADLMATTAFIDHDMLGGRGLLRGGCPNYWGSWSSGRCHLDVLATSARWR